MSFVIELVGISAKGFHGVRPEERSLGQVFSADIKLVVNQDLTKLEDDLENTVNYSAVATQVADCISNEQFALIETLASRIADLCLANELVGEATVRIHKPQAPLNVPFQDVSVEVTKRRP